jgi:hypothetical protein
MIKTSATAFAAELGVKLSLLLPAALGGLIALQFVDDPLDEQACKPCRKAVVFVTGTGLGIFCGSPHSTSPTTRAGSRWASP